LQGVSRDKRMEAVIGSISVLADPSMEGRREVIALSWNCAGCGE